MQRDLITSIIAKTLIILTCCIPSALAAQEYDSTPVTISKEKVRINGQVCYSHIVLEKQTLYSISKTYNVSIEEIYKYNPSVKKEGLKKNSILIIPVAVNTEKKSSAAQKEAEVKKETEAVRPEEVGKAAEEQKAETKPASEPEKQTGYQAQHGRRNHIVKWYEDIESIATKYGVGVNAIMQANNLKTKKLSKRQRLIIPFPGEYPDEAPAEDIVEYAQSDSTSVSDSLSDDSERSLLREFLFPKKEIDLTLLMPLNADGNTCSAQNMDFYSGVLLAVHDMKKEGISTNIDVYDIAGGNFAPSRESLLRSDIVIGPVASGDITRVFEAMPGVKGLVSPLDPRAEKIAYSQKAMVHAPTPHSAQYIDLVSWIKEDMRPGDRVLLITEKGAKQNAAVSSMTAAIDSSGIEYKPLSYSILEGRNITNTLAYLMTETNTNRVYIASESEAFVNDVVRNLNVMIHQKYDVVLYAPSKIRGFETIEVENFHNTNMHVSLGYYIDYNNDQVKEFLLKYRALFNTEPTQFAYQGYDLARYFISHCSKYGNRWPDKLEDSQDTMLQSKFDFVKTPDGGYVNNGVQRIIYGKDWSVEKVR